MTPEEKREFDSLRARLAEAQELLSDPDELELASGRALEEMGSFLVVRDWMRVELGLKGSDLFVYAILFGFTRHGRPFVGGTRYLEGVSGFSERSVKGSLSSLQGMGLVEATRNPIDGKKKLYRVDLDASLRAVRVAQSGDNVAFGVGVQTYPEPAPDEPRTQDDENSGSRAAEIVENSEVFDNRRTDDWCKKCTEHLIGAKTAPNRCKNCTNANNLLIEKIKDKGGGDMRARELRGCRKSSPQAPTVAEVRAFVADEGLAVDADALWRTMDESGWRDRDGKPIGDWRRLARSWSRGQASRPRRRSRADVPPISDEESIRRDRERYAFDSSPAPAGCVRMTVDGQSVTVARGGDLSAAFERVYAENPGLRPKWWPERGISAPPRARAGRAA